MFYNLLLISLIILSLFSFIYFCKEEKNKERLDVLNQIKKEENEELNRLCEKYEVDI